MLIYSASIIGAAWVMNRRRMYRPRAVPLSEEQIERLSPYFGASLLARVRVARLEHIENPSVYSLLPLLGLQPPMDLRTISGIALVDTVALAAPKNGIDQLGLLFHELVHVVQYDLLGVRGFIAAYLRGWLENGRDYFAIPLEQQAFELQERFIASSSFDVRNQLRRLMSLAV